MNNTYNRILDLVVNEGSGSAKSLVRRGLGDTLRANLRGAAGGQVGDDQEAWDDNSTVRYNRKARGRGDKLAEKRPQSVRHKFLVNKREKDKEDRAKQVDKMTQGTMRQRPSTL